MVAKTIRLSVIWMVITLVGCATTQVVTSEEQRKLANQPAESELKVEDSSSSETQITDKAPDSTSTTPTERSEAATKTEPKAQTAPAMTEPVPTPAQVVTRLQQEALQLQSEGRWSEAELKLERALRIDAEKVDIYHQLATVRMGQERFAQAEQIALKGLSLTDKTPKYKASLWEVIAQCRSAQGNIAGAREARSEMLKWLE
jgi:tetratricopeptide (TPR) repeat protein